MNQQSSALPKSREDALALVAQIERDSGEGPREVLVFATPEEWAMLLALAAKGAECVGATEAWVADTDLHHVQDSHGTRRRVLILPAAEG